jgi:glucarate dehydratase
MKIVDITAYSVAIPFTAPILSAMGVSYPARMRTIIQVHTDEGITGLGECGYSPLGTFTGTPQARAFEGPIKDLIAGENPFDSSWLRRKMRYSSEESVAIELACWDIMGKAVGLPVYRLLGGEGAKAAVEHSAYCFFRAPDRDGRNAVTLENHTEHCLQLAREHGFRTLKLKLGVYEPDIEVDAVIRLREAAGPHIRIVLDPNEAWSLATALYVAKRLEPYNILYYEDPIRYDEANLRRLQQVTATPICVSSEGHDELHVALQSGTADVVQADLYVSGGIRGAHQWYAIARAFQKPTAMHSGREIGVAQMAKMHVVAAQPDVVNATDGIYHQYVDDILPGGKLTYTDGAIALPDKPGLGVELDEQKLAQWELTDHIHQEMDTFWAETKRSLGIGPLDANNKARRF